MLPFELMKVRPDARTDASYSWSSSEDRAVTVRSRACIQRLRWAIRRSSLTTVKGA